MADKKKDPKNLAQLDKRIVERNVQRGVVSRADVDAHLKSLPDLADQADNIADRVYPADR
jgi:hypothetical protein